MDKNKLRALLVDIYRSTQDNRIPEVYDGQGKEVKILSEPLIGLAAAEDPIFENYKSPKVIGPWHMGPCQWLPGAKTVISVFFPFSQAVRESNRTAKDGEISYEWLYSRVEGQALINRIMGDFAKALRAEGISCVVPATDERFKSATGGIVMGEQQGVDEKSYGSNWSERHAAYAAGLGSFGLSKGLITEKGMAGRFASVIVDLALEADMRPYTGVYDYCTKCGACVRRCPVNAISLEKGKDHSVCSRWLDETAQRYAPRYGCGLCQTGVPCENRRP